MPKESQYSSLGSLVSVTVLENTGPWRQRLGSRTAVTTRVLRQTQQLRVKLKSPLCRWNRLKQPSTAFRWDHSFRTYALRTCHRHLPYTVTDNTKSRSPGAETGTSQSSSGSLIITDYYYINVLLGSQRSNVSLWNFTFPCSPAKIWVNQGTHRGHINREET